MVSVIKFFQLFCLFANFHNKILGKCYANTKLVKQQNIVNRHLIHSGSFVCLEKQLKGIKESLPSVC